GHDRRRSGQPRRSDARRRPRRRDRTVGRHLSRQRLPDSVDDGLAHGLPAVPAPGSLRKPGGGPTVSIVTATRVPAVTRWQLVPWLGLAVAATAAIGLPEVLTPYWTLIATNAVLAFAIAAPLNLLTGNAGQF